MRIGEVMKKTGLTKKAIHYYVSHGLVKPAVDVNGYYIFTTEDLMILEVIIRLRSLDFSIRDITSMLSDPETSIFTMIKKNREIKKSRSILSWQESCLSEIIDGSGNSITSDSLRELLMEFVTPLDSNETASQPIDDIDAALLATFFWGNFVNTSGMTEYQRFLWSRLKQSIIVNQTENIRKLRDIVYDFDAAGIKQNVFGYSSFYEEISKLNDNNKHIFVEKMIQQAKENLSNPGWVSQWKELYHNFYKPMAEFFDSKSSALMRELSPLFAQCQTNINDCCLMLLEYIESPEGEELSQLIKSKLSGYIDVKINHSGELAGLYAYQWK